jgi:predicted dehydrogenase
MEEVELVGMTDRSLAAARVTGLRAYSNLVDMIEQAKPHLLDVIVPPEGHAEIIGKARDAGLRTIICQKPFCTSLREVRAVGDRAEAAGALVIVLENFRFMPWYRFIRTELASGALGTLHQVTFRRTPETVSGATAYTRFSPMSSTRCVTAGDRKTRPAAIAMSCVSARPSTSLPQQAQRYRFESEAQKPNTACFF